MRNNFLTHLFDSLFVSPHEDYQKAWRNFMVLALWIGFTTTITLVLLIGQFIFTGSF